MVLSAEARLLGAPLIDVFVMTRKENIGDFHTAKIGGLGVLGIFEIIAVRETLDGRGGLTTEDAGEETSDGVDHNQCWEFTAGEDVGAHGDLEVN